MIDAGFYRMVAEAAFSNPFSRDRAELDQKIAGQTEVGGGENAVDAVIAKVAASVRRLETGGRADIRQYRGEERRLMQTVLLFDVFHRFLDDFDELILRQERSGDEPCTVAFAPDALSALTGRGFSGEEARRYLAIFYQLRRAFYFISKGLVGRSPCMRTLRMHLWNSVFTHDVRRYESLLWNRMEDFSTLILGETGTGKGAAAAAIGRSGFIPFDEKSGSFTESFTRNFISLNLSQFPESLIESELFGHRKGAFTGAIENHEGVFSRCTPHGSIFLDELGEVSAPVQIKLLNILQDRTFSPVGSHARLRFHGRVVAATNRPLAELRGKGRFRDDFFYRISSDIIEVPPLRQRIEEDPGELDGLARHLLGRMTGDGSEEAAGSVLEVLGGCLRRGYAWPGNVRELEQAIRRILVIRRYDPAPSAPALDAASELAARIDAGAIDARTLLSDYCGMLYARHGSYEEVSRITGLDRRTAKRYVLFSGTQGHSS